MRLSLRLLILLVTGFLHYAQGGMNLTKAELDEEITTSRQIRLGTTQSLLEASGLSRGRSLGTTRIGCKFPGIFVLAPDGCNRCYCGDNFYLSHRCTRAYCPPGFPSEQDNPPTQLNGNELILS